MSCHKDLILKAVRKKSTTWNDVLRVVKTRLNKDVYNTWFRPIKFESIDPGQKILNIRAGQITKDWVCLYYSELLEQVMAELDMSDHSLEWQVDPDQPIEPLFADEANADLFFSPKNGAAATMTWF